MIKITKEVAKEIEELHSDMSRAKNLAGIYALQVSDQAKTMKAMACELEDVWAYYAIADRAKYETAIQAVNEIPQVRLGAERNKIAILEVALDGLVPVAEIEQSLTDAQGRADVRLLNTDHIISLIADCQRDCKRGERVTVDTFERMPKAYRYPVSYTVAEAVKRKSDGAIIVTIERLAKR